MLKLDDKVWIYYPQADRVVTIAGHMLRQSVMGSDLSYEDMMENDTLADSYRGELIGEQLIDQRKVWVLDLTAKNPSAAYPKRRLWIDQERHVCLKEHLLSSTNILLKSVVVRDVKQFDKRWYPVHFVFKDELKKGKGTEYLIHEIKFLEDRIQNIRETTPSALKESRSYIYLSKTPCDLVGFK